MNNSKINSRKMINYIIKTDELQENMQNNTDIMKIIHKIFSNPINPYSKEVLKNIIAKILNKNKIDEIQKKIIIKILDKLHSDQKPLSNIDLIIYIIDKIYLYNITNEKKDLIDLINSGFNEEFKNYIKLYEVKNIIKEVQPEVSLIKEREKNIKTLNNVIEKNTLFEPLNQKNNLLTSVVQEEVQPEVSLIKEGEENIKISNNVIEEKPLFESSTNFKVGNEVETTLRGKKRIGKINSIYKNESGVNRIILNKKTNSGENINVRKNSIKKIKPSNQKNNLLTGLVQEEVQPEVSLIPKNIKISNNVIEEKPLFESSNNFKVGNEVETIFKGRKRIGKINSIYKNNSGVNRIILNTKTSSGENINVRKNSVMKKNIANNIIP